jgi:hypothetical protein
MRVAWIKLGGAASAAVLALLLSAPVKATDQSGMTTIAAEELDKRSRQPESSESGGLSESSVRVMVTYAFSLIPEQIQGPDGQSVTVDKSDPNKYVLPSDDARRVIRAATRSAYAEVCGLPELGEANYKTMLAQEQSKDWSREQILMIEALHLFAVSYFTGNAKITETSEEAPAAGGAGDGTTTISKGGEGGETQEVEAPPAPKCPPEQKQKVQNAIQAYVQAAQAN